MLCPLQTQHLGLCSSFRFVSRYLSSWRLIAEFTTGWFKSAILDVIHSIWLPSTSHWIVQIGFNLTLEICCDLLAPSNTLASPVSAYQHWTTWTLKRSQRHSPALTALTPKRFSPWAALEHLLPVLIRVGQIFLWFIFLPALVLDATFKHDWFLLQTNFSLKVYTKDMSMFQRGGLKVCRMSEFSRITQT